MSFDSHSELQPHLLALTQIAQWHADAHQLPLELRFAVHEGTVDTVRTAITGVIETQAPADYTRVATDTVMDLARTENFSGSFTVRINVSPGEQAIVKQTPLADNHAPQASTTPQSSQTVISSDGLRLRSALLKHGHTAGYSPDEITAEERKRGFAFPPELKFYRTLVREGVVTQIGGKNVLASNLEADFGESTLNTRFSSQANTEVPSLHKVPWKVPSANTVQAVLNHHLWVEIAHSETHLYAFDMAPGPTGTAGQIIARRIGEASVPVMVAGSLAQFVTGESLNSQVPGRPSKAPQPENPFGKTIAWVGTVPPITSPMPLGWSGVLTKAQHPQGTQSSSNAISVNTKTGKHDVARLPSRQPPTPEEESISQGTTTLFSKKPNPGNPAAVLTADTEPIPRYEPRLHKPAHPGSKPGRPTPTPDTLSAGYRAYQANKARQEKRDERQAIKPAQFEGLDSILGTDIDNLDSSVIYTPISPEQKNIATAIGTLAFGTKEEREEYRATDTSPIPSLDTRGKKLSLTSTPPTELAAQRAGKQADNNLRSTLRKLFTGGNQV